MGNVTTRVKDKLSQCSGRCPTGSSGERGNDPWSDPSKGMVGNPYKQTPTSSPFLGSAAPVRGESVEYEDEAEPPHASPQPVAAEEPAAPHVENTALASLMHSRLAHAGGEAPEVDRSEEKPTRSRRHTPKKIANPPSRRTMSVDRSVMLRKTMPPPENSAGSCFSCGGVKEPPPDVRERCAVSLMSSTLFPLIATPAFDSQALAQFSS